MQNNQQPIVWGDRLQGRDITQAGLKRDCLAILDQLEPRCVFAEIPEFAASKFLAVSQIGNQGRAASDLVVLWFDPKLVCDCGCRDKRYNNRG